MTKTYAIDISEFSGFLVKEAFDFFACYDLTKLKWNIRWHKHNFCCEKDAYDFLMGIRNCNAGNIRGIVFHEINKIENAVGSVSNIRVDENHIVFDFKFLNTPWGIKYAEYDDACFEVVLRKDTGKVDTAGANPIFVEASPVENGVLILSFIIRRGPKSEISMIRHSG